MNRFIIILFLMVALAGNAFTASGTNPIAAKSFTGHTGWNFVENKGQLSSPEIKYYARPNKGVNLYCKPGIISFVFTKTVQMDPFGKNEPDQKSDATGEIKELNGNNHAAAISPFRGGRGRIYDSKPSKITTSRADLVLLHSNPAAEIIASDQQEFYENFYLANTGEAGITHVNTYKTITYKSIYPNIDFILHAGDGGLEYEFVVYPGGNVRDIQIQWNGIERIKRLEDSKIEYFLALGEMTELSPYTYQRASNVIPSHSILKNNTIGFKTGKYDKTKLLVIDPFLSWATYFGGSAFDASNSVATDHSGNVYITGYAESQSGIATTGAFQTSFGGDVEDAFIAKFSSSGTLLWATYYGGNGNDYGTGISADGFGNLYLSAVTESASGIATSGAYQTYFTGSSEAVLAKFNSNGTRQWATYYGGKGSFSSGVAADGLGNVYFTGSTFFNNIGVSTNAAFQTIFGGGAGGDAFLAKFSSSGSILWGTYYGGIGGEGGSGVAIDDIGNAYMVGTTAGSPGLATTGAYQTSNAGVAGSGTEDVFLAKFNSTGKIQWSTYYGGKDNEDGLAVAVDKSRNVFITGETSSTYRIATNGAYQTSLATMGPGGTDIFIAKFNNSGSMQWATYYGGEGNDYGYGVTVDISGNPFIVGTTQSISGIATAGAYQTSYGGGNEHAFLAEFSNAGARLWATYIGGTNDDVGSGVASDGSGNTYITGYTKSFSGISTVGSYQSYIKGSQNAFLAQFNFKADYDAGLSFYYGDSNVCAGLRNIIVDLGNYGNDPFDSVDISWSFNGKLQPVYHWKAPARPGLPPENSSSAYLGNILFSVGKKDTIKAWTSRPNGQIDSMSWNDTSSIIITVNPLPVAPKYPAQTICEYSYDTLGGPYPTGYSYSWTSNPVGFTSTFTTPVIIPIKTSTYYEEITNIKTGCFNTDTVKITVNPAPPAITGPAKTICFKDTISLGDTSSKGFIYNWTSTPSGFSSTLSNPKISPASNTSYTLKEKNTVTGCTNANAVQINVNQLPVANVGAPSYSICNGTHIKIGANAQSGITYLWASSPAGYSSTLSNPVVDPGAYTQYYLTVTDTATGCVNKNFANVAVSILKAPLIDVGKNQAVCVGVSAQIGSTPVVGYTYSWTSNPVGYTSTVAKPIVTPLVTSSYSLIVTDTHGCTNFDSVTITVNPRPHPNPGAPQNSCSGTVIKLGAPTDSGRSYLWTSQPTGFGSKISDPIDSPKVSMEYYLKETILATGCADSDSVKITVMPRPNAQFDAKNINGYGFQFVIQKPNYPGLQYHWTFGSSTSSDTTSATSDTASGYNVFHTYPQNGSYLVILTISVTGFCTVIDSYRVIVNVTPSFDIYPNPFGLQTDIKYVLENPGHVKITMTDDIGRFIGTLVDKQLSRGEYITVYDAAAWKTRPAVYFITYQLDDKVIVKKIVQIDSIYH